MDIDSGELTPAQRKVLEVLGADAAHRPTFDPDLRQLLRARLDAGLAPSKAQIPKDTTIWVSKHSLALVHGCEAHFLADRDEKFEISLPMVIGTVTHKAIELSLHWQGAIVPADLVEHAIASLENGDSWTTDFIQTRSEREKAELRSDAVERFTSFTETFPPLKAGWRPVTESRTRIELMDGLVILSGKIDLSLGQPRGNQAGKVLIDFKTGRRFDGHLADLRFYALLETLRVGVPPRMLASYYLEQGELVPESVTEGLLDATEARTIDGVRRMIDLVSDEREPKKHPGGPCNWCPLNNTCEEGREHLANRATDDY